MSEQKCSLRCLINKGETLNTFSIFSDPPELIRTPYPVPPMMYFSLELCAFLIFENVFDWLITSQQTFRCRFNIVFRLIWRRNVAQRQINVETTLCTSMLIFKTLNNVESTLSISRLIWTTLDNVEKRCHFQRSFWQHWGTSKQRCEYDHLKKIRLKPRVKNKIIYLSFKENTGLKIFFILFFILRGICKKIFAEPQNFLKLQIYGITKTV